MSGESAHVGCLCPGPFNDAGPERVVVVVSRHDASARPASGASGFRLDGGVLPGVLPDGDRSIVTPEPLRGRNSALPVLHRFRSKEPRQQLATRPPRPAY